ncbi:MAG: MarR family transcriptional regulator [Clostridia bacterium]|nr:MarR family transcriptional regulator [Clostridia bacterium]
MEENSKIVFYRLLRQNARGIKGEIFKLMSTENFNHSQINLILHLRLNESRSLNKLSKIVQVQKSNMTTLVDSLEKLKIVKRSRDENDRRSINLTLTESGEKVRQELAAEYEKNLSAILGDISDSDIENAIKILQTIKDKIWG